MSHNKDKANTKQQMDLCKMKTIETPQTLISNFGIHRLPSWRTKQDQTS